MKQVQIEWNPALMTAIEFLKRCKAVDIPWEKLMIAGEIEGVDGVLQITLHREH